MRIAPGELAVAAIFLAMGAFWVFHALKLPLKDGFAPSSGFLPLVFGLLLVGLTIAAVLAEVRSSQVSAPMRRSLVVLFALVAGVAAMPLIGFVVAMALMCLFLFRYCEGHAIVSSALASVGTAIGLTLIFRLWLGVPLPTGPWGF